ncbi:hypothetical protein T484DRAFT_1846143 [Baffinella frigidus]|nr:hypothetical protein T484DRAFT_1846143 [Cryptophyta sp. CCMP2293]
MASARSERRQGPNGSQGSKRVSGEDAEVSSILEEARALTASTERSLQRARTAELVLRSSRSASRPTSHIPTPELSAHASEEPPSYDL